MADNKTSLTYRDAGVDIDAGNALIDRIKPHTQRAKRPEVLGGIGGFGALMSIPASYKNPVLVSGTDGVGTKLKLAIDTGIYDTIGIDLVAMCVNDIIVTGAEPLFFLDYYATGKLDLDVAESVIKGIADGCVLSGAALTGGETAEMPGMYAKDDFDLAGFSVGVVERDDIIDQSGIKNGDAIIGLASSGPHSNGYSLIRKIIEISGISLDEPFDGRTFGEALLAPTTIYVKTLLHAIKALDISALAHITGGGLTENIPRVLPKNTKAVIDLKAWKRPAIFEWLKEQGNVADDEMLRTFNCGIGMAVIVPQAQVEDALGIFKQSQVNSWVIGRVSTSNQVEPYTEFISTNVCC